MADADAYEALHSRIVSGDRKAAETAMRRHLSHVAQTLPAVANGDRAA